MENTKIQWAHHTHNEWTGCTKVSQGCKWCYAEALGLRSGRHPDGYVAGSERKLTSEDNRRQPFAWDRQAREAGERYRVFTNSLSDVFDDEVPDSWRYTLFARMVLTPSLDWLVLTKRAAKMKAFMTAPECADRINSAAADLWIAAHERRKGQLPDATTRGLFDAGPLLPLRNVWLGVSVEDQKAAEERIPLLLDTPAAVRFLSCEPLLGPVSLDGVSVPAADFTSVWNVLAGTRGNGGGWSTGNPRIDWVIVGGESYQVKTVARPCSVEWIRGIVRQCMRAHVACFVKQLGSQPETHAGDVEAQDTARTIHGNTVGRLVFQDRKGGDPEEWPNDLRVRQFPVVVR